MNSDKSNARNWLIPIVVAALVGGYVLSKARPQTIDHPADMTRFAGITVSYEGRLQPMDSVARNSLLLISTRTQWTSDLLTADQIQDYVGLAKAIQTAGAADAPSPGKRVWSVMTAEHRKAIEEAARALEMSPSMKLRMLDALNWAIDDVGRFVILSHKGQASGDVQMLYESRAFTTVTIDAPQREQLDLAKAWLEKGGLFRGEGVVIPSRPLNIEANRLLLARAFDGYLSAGKTRRLPAILWLADTVADAPDGTAAAAAADRPAYSTAHRVFRVVHPRLLQLMGVQERPGFRYALDELIEPDLVHDLITREFSPDEEVFQGRLGKLQHEVRLAGEEGRDDPFYKQASQLWRNLNSYLSFVHRSKPFWVPPSSPTAGEWRPFGAVRRPSPDGGFAWSNEYGESLWKMLAAYRAGDVASFDKLAKSHRTALDQLFESDTARASFELFFNRFDVFYHCTVMYVLAFLLVMFSWLLWQYPGIAEPLRRSAFASLVVLMVIHGFGLICRMYLMDRAMVFVTNLYSTAIFIGWIALLAALIMEWFTRLGFGSLSAAVVGVVTGIIAVNLRIDRGDTLELQQAVLDTNFWLATHVTAINIGYAATYVAGALGIAYIIAGVFTRGIDGETRKKLSQMLYGTICFALLFSFVGTVLGGIWADQSWGRFWGWDPKENGALLIVIWNAIILHARWGGMIKMRGLASLSVFGNIVTTWSYFGTNQLGVGLHSYGFMESAVFWILAFAASQMAIIAISLIPERYWRSFAKRDETEGMSRSVPSAG